MLIKTYHINMMLKLILTISQFVYCANNNLEIFLKSPNVELLNLVKFLHKNIPECSNGEHTSDII